MNNIRVKIILMFIFFLNHFFIINLCDKLVSQSGKLRISNSMLIKKVVEHNLNQRIVQRGLCHGSKASMLHQQLHEALILLLLFCGDEKGEQWDVRKRTTAVSFDGLSCAQYSLRFLTLSNLLLFHLS